MKEVEFPFEDMLGMTSDANWGEQAVAQLFGIVNSWVEADITGSNAPDKLFVIGCVVCEQGMSFGFTNTMIESVKGGKDTLEQQGYRAYAQEANCQHYEQFEAFILELDKETEHALMLADAIANRARLLALA